MWGVILKSIWAALLHGKGVNNLFNYKSYVEFLNILPMCEINMSPSSVDSLRTLQSKFSPPGAIPPCSNTVCKDRTYHIIQFTLILHKTTHVHVCYLIKACCDQTSERRCLRTHFYITNLERKRKGFQWILNHYE